MTSRPDLESEVRTVPLRALGVAVELRLTGAISPYAVEQIERAWNLCADPGGDRGHPEVVELTTMDDVALLPAAVTRAVVNAQMGSLLMLRGLGLQDPGSGATTVVIGADRETTSAIIERFGKGRAYLSDAVVGVSEDGALVPYAKPVAIVDQSGRRRQEHPLGLGLLAPVEGRVDTVVLLECDETATEAAEGEELGTLDAIAHLTPHTSYMPELHQPLQRMRRLCEAARVVRVRFGDVAQLEDALQPVLVGAR